MSKLPDQNDACAKFLLKALAKTMQQYKRNPSMALAHEIGYRQKELDMWPYWNEVSMGMVLKITKMDNAVKLFVMMHMKSKLFL